MALPKFLQKFRKEAEKCLVKGWVRGLEFSGPTYQIKVFDETSKEDVWAFLQLDPKGWIKDSFCSCNEGEACVHIAAGYLRIFKDAGAPLHDRFQHSLWNRLCFLYQDHCGDNRDIIHENKPGCYTISSLDNIHSFQAVVKNGKGASRLKQILLQQSEETEENSLKFSNLSEDEIALWRQGRPSFQLKYELSFWNDLAQCLFLMQDEGLKYKIHFKYTPEGLPNEIQVSFSEFELHFIISEKDLSYIVPSLEGVNSPLKVYYEVDDAIKKITYDKVAGELLIDYKKGKKGTHKEGIHFNGWLFVPQDGFYSESQDNHLQGSKLSGKDISEALKDNYAQIKAHLKGTTLHLEPIHVSYQIHFDHLWNLHQTAYLFEPGDLSKPYSRIFEDWVYLEDDGFYPFEGDHPDVVHQVIHQTEVGDFIRDNRSWISHIEGFQFHVSGIEAKLSYKMSEDSELSFYQRSVFDDTSRDYKDFGEWVYVRGEGFYVKEGAVFSGSIPSGLVIRADQIPLFIRQHRDELQVISGFFSSKCPISKAGIRIVIQDDGTILISPEYIVLEKYRQKKIRFFDAFVYTPGEGFSELQGEARLPEHFRHPIHVTKAKLYHFIRVELHLIRSLATYIDPRLNPPKKLELVAESIEKKEGSYILKLHYFLDSKAIKFGTLWQAIHQKEHFLFGDGGLISLDDDRFHPLRWIMKKKIDLRSNKLVLSAMELLRMMAFDPFEVKEGKEYLDELLNKGIIDEPNLEGMEGTLRPYQIHGVQWLFNLYHRNLSGLLCDDMGLGKTHQAMALLVAVRNTNHQKPFLIICPTSVLYHWEEKLKKYLPHLRVCLFHGIGRILEQHDVLVTSYGIWRREHLFLSTFEYEVVIFDEIQAAKNPESQLFNSLKSVKARMRLGLTGTPIENRLVDLKSLFDLVLPHYMPPEADYKRFFVIPIERDFDKKRQALLSRYIYPFILRRRKKEVLLDLPEKVEEIAYCDLLPDQAYLYNEVLVRMREGVLTDINGGRVSYIHIFAVLSALKQICNHPAAYLKTPEEYKDYSSGKWDLFVELLSEARGSQQKVVIFSQYLAMLDIMENYLTENQIQYATIRGATIERGKEVERFNKDPLCEVFLGSLQAAGWGIDLTGASVVIHYDRWWNAARENQATDRVHRIGQTRGVQVFKLVTKGSFEERIDTLIAQKGKMLEEVVGFDDHQFIKNFTQDEILQLLQEVKIY